MGKVILPSKNFLEIREDTMYNILNTALGMFLVINFFFLPAVLYLLQGEDRLKEFVSQ